MITYKINKTNNEYIMINVKMKLVQALFIEEVPDFIKANINNIFNDLYDYEKYNKCYVIKEDINIRKDSDLGKYILEHDEIFYDDNNNITYDKVVNAYNISVFEKNCKMSNKILILFKDRISGTKEELCDLVNEDVVNYIIEHSDFKIYLDGIDGVLEDKEYLVYEDGEFNRKKLSRKSKVLSKCNS